MIYKVLISNKGWEIVVSKQNAIPENYESIFEFRRMTTLVNKENGITHRRWLKPKSETYHLLIKCRANLK